VEPYYDDGEVTLYLGDCRVAREWVAADVLVTDPPYGVAYRSNFSRFGSTPPIVGDEDAGLRDEVLELWGAGPALVFGSWKVPRPPATRHRLIWDKRNPGMGDLGIPWGPGDEEIYVIGAGFVGPRESNVIRAQTLPASDARRPPHPTPKPVALMEYLIAKCPPGIIADPFAGSGSTLLAARNLGRRAVGVEIDEAYCELIVSRLGQQAFVFEL
jgi:site-specific DNA-methyltransferase (adenine-specific)